MSFSIFPSITTLGASQSSKLPSLVEIAEEVAVWRLLILSHKEVREGGREFFVTNLPVVICVNDVESFRRLLRVVAEKFEEVLQLGHLDETVTVGVDNSEHDITDALIDGAQPLATLLAEESDEVLWCDGLGLTVSLDHFLPDGNKLFLDFCLSCLVDDRRPGEPFPQKFVVLLRHNTILVDVEDREELAPLALKESLRTFRLS